MSHVSHRCRGVVRVAPALAGCGLAMLLAGSGALADSGQARDMAAGGLPPLHPSAVAVSATAATARSVRSRGMSRAAGALRYGTLDDRVPAAATLEKCATASNSLERYAIFFGRMNAVPGSASMAMRIGIEERAPHEAFHAVEATGTPELGAWRLSEPGVKIFKDVKQVGNLSAPADYRAVVHFRWTNAKGLVIKREALRTLVCRQPADEAQVGGQTSTARMR